MTSTVVDLYNKSWGLSNLGKDEEALVLYKQCIELDSGYANSYWGAGNCYLRIGKLTEAIEMFTKYLEKAGQNSNDVAFLGRTHEDNGNVEEAKKLYLRALELNPKEFKPNVYQAALLTKEGKLQEALEHYARTLDQYPTEPLTAYHMGDLYKKLGQEDEAIKCFSKVDMSNPSGPLQFCYKGQCYNMLNRQEDALKNFKISQEKMETDKTLFYARSAIEHIKSVLASILDVEKAAAAAESEMKKVDLTNPIFTKFAQKIKKLQADKADLQNKAIQSIDKSQPTEARNILSDFDKLKQGFDQQLAELKEEMNKKIVKLEVNVEHLNQDVAVLKLNMDDLKKEISSKMDDFEKKLRSELDKQDLSPDDQQKLIGYFRAFVETFSSIHVTSQVIDSGQVQLDTGNSAVTILSFVASFAPFIGSGLSSTVKTIGDFLVSKEMKTNARMMKRLAPDATKLSQLIGKSAYEIVMNKEKRQVILLTRDEDLNEISGALFKKVLQFCKNLDEKIDAYLYSEMYQSVGERVGHNDANELVEKWINGDVTPYGIEKQFIVQILKQHDSEYANMVMQTHSATSSPGAKINSATSSPGKLSKSAASSPGKKSGNGSSSLCSIF